jgi:hypothetical protein
MLRKTESLTTSECVLNILLNSENFYIRHIDGLIEAYQNGREHGHIIFGLSSTAPEYKVVSTAFYICTARRSDKICIYKGAYAMQGISDDAYSNPKYFERGQFYEAAAWLASELNMLLPQYIATTNEK